MRNDNLACFVTLEGRPVDPGAADLYRQRKLPEYDDLILHKAKVSTMGSRKLILLPIKQSALHEVTEDDINECLRALYDVVTELQLTSVSISKSSLDGIPPEYTTSSLIAIFGRTNTQVFLCSNEVQIPAEDRRQEILKENHESAYAGHKGITKTYRRIREKFYWRTLKQDVTIFVNNCPSCQLKKLTRVKTRLPMRLTDTPGRAFDKVSLDVVGPLPMTPDGYQYILTMQDLLTKYSVAAPLKSIGAIDTADAFIENLICRFGAPKAILTDQGSNFTSALMKEVAKRFRISRTQATAFHPQTNGSIERSHMVLAEYLKQFVRGSDWNKWLNLAMLSYNTSTHEGTNFTPHELVFGHLANVPTADVTHYNLENETYNNYLRELQTKLIDIQSQARENLSRAKERSKRYYDNRLNPVTFSVGDLVYLLKEPRVGKFDAQYTGPHEVIETIDSHNVKIKIGASYKIVHANKLKKANTPALSHPRPSLPQVHHVRENTSPNPDRS